MELDTSKNAMQNIVLLYDNLKKLKAKRQRILQEIERTNIKLKKEAQNPNQNTPTKSKKSSGKKKKKWWHLYRSFETSGGFRVVGGKNAKQNDELYAKHLMEDDLFFHADIQGAPTIILKRAKVASREDILQTAQFAACFSSAWKTGAAAVNVYAVEKSQVSKHSSGGYIGRGAFAIGGERQWFRKTELKLKIGKKEGEILLLPFIHSSELDSQVSLKPGSLEKEEASIKLSAHLSCKKDEVLQLLPNGKIALSI